MYRCGFLLKWKHPYRCDEEETITIPSKEYNRLLQQEVQLYGIKGKLEAYQTTCSQKSNEINKLKTLLLYYKKKESKTSINHNDHNEEWDDPENTEDDEEDAVTNVN